MKSAAVTKKPSINALTEQATTFAEAPQAAHNKPAIASAGEGTLRITEAGKRSFVAPPDDRRLTINIRKDLHKKLKYLAVEQETNVGNILEKLIEQHLAELGR